jgi:hypothetical protein
MKQLSEPTRRSFLASLVALGGGICLSGAGGCGLLRNVKQEAASLNLLLGKAEQAQAIGRAYLDANPSEAELKTLVDLLIRDLDWRSDQASASTLRNRLAERVKTEFNEDKIARVEGWWLAQSEARICGLAVLLAAA